MTRSTARAMALVTAALVAWAAGCNGPGDARAEPATTQSMIEVFPKSRVVPENLLKFHIHFARPMARGWAREHVYLADAEGRRIAGALLDPIHELWDPDQRHLTMFLDPARVKTGLAVHDQLGRALVAGRAHGLVVTPGWPTLAGDLLEDGFEHRFRAGPADRDSPDIQAWSVTAPPANSREPLSIRFPEPYDQACLALFVRIVDSQGRTVPGDIRLAGGDREWRFVPFSPWTAQRYRVAVDFRLEDLAGNNLREVFDRPLGRSGVQGQASGQTAYLDVLVHQLRARDAESR